MVLISTSGVDCAKRCILVIIGVTRQGKKAFDLFIKTYELKYPKATHALNKDREELFAFYDFPADYWSHIRTTNPIESTFPAIRWRAKKPRASGTTILIMACKLGLSAEKGWRKLQGFRRLADIINIVEFIDGKDVETLERQRTAT
jgi:putative transposase